MIDQQFLGGEALYLFFGVYNSPFFVGCAKVRSKVNFKARFMGWYPQFASRGCFAVQWLYVRDLPLSLLKFMKTNAGTSLADAQDAEELSFHFGKKLLNMFQRQTQAESLLDDFPYYNQKEEYINALTTDHR